MARSIFYSAIKEHSLNRGCCVILVTHQHQFAGDVHSCLYTSAAKILANGSFSKCVSISDGKITNPVKTEKVHNRNEQPIFRDEKKDLVQTKNSETITIGDDTQAEKKNHRNHSFRDLESIRSCSWRSGRVILLSITRAYFVFYCLIRASRRLRHRMLKSVLRSMIQFYDSNPLGRILSRFSADVGICDVTLPLTIYDYQFLQ